MKLTSKIHGIIDYIVVIFLWLSPTLFSLPETTSLFTYLLGGIHLTLTVLTNFEYGLFKIIPLKIHGTIELIVSIALIGVAFYLGGLEGDLARNFYIGFAVAVFLTWLLSDYQSVKTIS
ncbi:MAG: hypothetical protein R3E32_24885 [Chitinophagales bacterium]